MGRRDSLSTDFVAAAVERDALAARLLNAQARVEHFDARAAQAREEAESLAASIRALF
jgi:hypothetical protein